MGERTFFRLRLVIPLLLLLAVGCGPKRYPVTGHVTAEDGTPVEAGTVIAEATVNGKAVAVQANIEKDGSFRWGSERPGDGAVPGSYKVLVMPRALGEYEIAEGKRPDIDSKYGKYETSGITFDVKPEKNVLNITVSRPKPRNPASNTAVGAPKEN
jgi:hypothetical protein